MLHRDIGENLSALNPRDTQGFFIISTSSSHLWLSQESIKLPHFPCTFHRHLCLYELQGAQSMALQISPCCSSSEVEDFHFYHIFFTTSLFSSVSIPGNFWGYKDAAHLQNPSWLSLQPSPCSRCLAWLGQLFLAIQGIEQRERGKSFKPSSGQGWNHRSRSSLRIRERSEEKRRKILNVGHGSCELLTALTCWVVKEMFSTPSVFIFLLRELCIAGGGKEK